MKSIVLDPFVGSGTTIKACIKLNRHFIGIDINPECAKYVGIEPSDDFDNPIDKLYIGDCLIILKELYKKHGEFVDLIYADPPFGRNGTDKAFGINWSTYPTNPSLLSRLYGTDTLKQMPYHKKAFYTWIYPRIEMMHKVLKPTGSMYLHCDPGV